MISIFYVGVGVRVTVGVGVLVPILFAIILTEAIATSPSESITFPIHIYSPVFGMFILLDVNVVDVLLFDVPAHVPLNA